MNKKIHISFPIDCQTSEVYWEKYFYCLFICILLLLNISLFRFAVVDNPHLHNLFSGLLWFKLFFLRFPFMQSIHLRLGRPLFLFPCSSVSMVSLLLWSSQSLLCIIYLFVLLLVKNVFMVLRKWLDGMKNIRSFRRKLIEPCCY